MTDLLERTDRGLARAVDLLGDGEVVAFPTDTVYGVGVAASRADRLDALFALKRRPLDRRIPMLVTDLAQATDAGWLADERAHRLAERFWPGALTLVLPAADGGATQAFRAPDHKIALELIRRAGPILATSANRSDEPDARGGRSADRLRHTAGRVAAVVDGGPVPGGVASTVVDLSVTPAQVLREGPMTREQLAEVIELAP